LHPDAGSYKKLACVDDCGSEGPALILGRFKNGAVMTNTPLKKVKNFGPVTLAEFEAMGLTTLEQVKLLGFDETCRKWIQYFPDRLNANAFIGIICAIEDTVWTKATSEQRRTAHAMVKELKSEFGRALKSK
jgi:hypothetical protein